VAIELNELVVRRAEWQTTRLQPDDKIEIVHFVGGGA
jgi:thiamine biosynthesis protein ThiS